MKFCSFIVLVGAVAFVVSGVASSWNEIDPFKVSVILMLLGIGAMLAAIWMKLP